MAERRRHWRVWQRYMDPKRFVFLDETGAANNMIRRYGWRRRRERLVDAVSHGHWRTTTFIAGLRSTGLVASLVLDGPMTGEAFLAYFGQFLAPTLTKGDVVVLDNLAAHKVAGVHEAIRATGASLLYLPPYSPDLNPLRSTAPSAGRRQAKGPAPESRSPYPGSPLDVHRTPAQHLHPSRVLQLPRQLRLCVRVNWKALGRSLGSLCVSGPHNPGLGARGCFSALPGSPNPISPPFKDGLAELPVALVPTQWPKI
ncbi:transposase [Roseomonas sp. WA12]